MNWPLFQTACLVVLAFAYALLYRDTAPSERRRLTTTIVLIALTSWAAEETSILRYGFYGYPDTWWLKLDEVPLIVVLIWPLVVLTADQVIRALFPGLSRIGHAFAIGLMVFIDASLVETVAVASDLWFWVEGGYLGAPLIGLIGWAAYAFSIALVLPSHPKSPSPVTRSPDSARPSPTPASFTTRLTHRLDDLAHDLHSPSPWLACLVTCAMSLAVTHALLVLTWWAFLRHALRDELPHYAAYIALAVSISISVIMIRRPHRIPLATAIPRAAATSVFVVLLALYAEGPPLYVHFAAIALPYLALISWRPNRALA